MKTLPGSDKTDLRLALILEYLKHPEFCRDLQQCDDTEAFCDRWGLTFDDGAGVAAVAGYHEMRESLGRTREQWPPDRLISEIAQYGGAMPEMEIAPGIRWDPTEESMKDANNRLKPERAKANRRKRAEMRAGLRRIENEASGLPDPAQKRSALEDHVRWVFRYQARCQSAEAIAEDEAMRGDKAVQLAINRVADLMGLRLRDPLRKGRKPKDKECKKARKFVPY